MALAQRHSVTLAMAATVTTLTFAHGWIYDLKQWTYKVARGEDLADPIEPTTGKKRGATYGPQPGGGFTPDAIKHLNPKTAGAVVLLWAILAGIADTAAFADLGVALAWAIAVSVMLYWGDEAAQGVREVI